MKVKIYKEKVIKIKIYKNVQKRLKNSWSAESQKIMN